MGFIESGEDNSLMEWREHGLSNLMRNRGESPLLLEPVVHPPGAFSNRRLNYHWDDREGIFWSWGDSWKEVLAKPHTGNHSSGVIKRHSGERGLISWSDAPFCDYWEFTPVDKQGNEGVTTCIKCPIIPPVDFVVYEPAHEGLSEKIRVKLRGGVPREIAFVQKVQFSGQQFQREDKPLSFNRSGHVEVAVGSFRGVIAVLLGINSGEHRLISYRWYTKDYGKPENRMSEADWSAINTQIQKTGVSIAPDVPPVLYRWLKQWPSRSQAMLKALHQVATKFLGLSPTKASEALQQTPTGLFRAVVLQRCGYSSAEQLDRLIKWLQSLTSLQFLQLLISRVPADFEQLSAPEKEWILKHRNNRDSIEAVEWARGHGVTALDRALELIDLRVHARADKKDLQITDKEGLPIPSKESKQADSLLGRVEQAPFNNDSIGDIRRSLNNLRQRIEEDKRALINPIGNAPITASQYDEWLKALDRLQLWQLELARIIDLCETGQWQRILPNKPPSQEELERRLRLIKAPTAQPRSKKAHDLNDKIKYKIEHLLNNGLINELINNKINKDQRAMYVFALEHLRKVVLPHATCWVAWHEDIRRASNRVSEFTWFARSAGMFSGSADLDERVRAAQDFLDMIEAFEQVAASWTPPIRLWKQYRLASTQAELEEILSSVDHPQVAQAYTSYTTLQSILGLRASGKTSSQLNTLPLSPQDVSVHTLKKWWETLALLDKALDELEKKNKIFQHSEKKIYLQYQPKIKKILERWRDAKPQPHYYRNLEGLYKQCENAGANVTREAVSDLISFIGRTPDLYEDIRRL